MSDGFISSPLGLWKIVLRLCVEVLSVDGINEDLPQVTLLFHHLLLLLQQTHDTKSYLSGGTPNIIFAPDDSLAYILDLSAVLFSDFI